MTTIKHIPVKHDPCVVRDDLRCPICDFGLFECAVCGGAEGELPMECPGILMTGEQKDRVMAGSLDYQLGRWFEPKEREPSGVIRIPTVNSKRFQ